MNLVVVIQARMASTRLPGKVLLPLAGRPLLERMIDRVRAARTPFHLVVATTTSAQDESIRAVCKNIGVACFSGHPTDLLDRHVQIGRTLHADAVAKIPSDCPLVDPRVIDRVLGTFLDAPGLWDYVSNLHPASYPDGNDVEVMTMEALETAWREARRPFEREHTTPFLWERPDRFRLHNVTWEGGHDLSMTHRFTIDYPEDYDFLTAVFAALWRSSGPPFALHEILALLEREPSIRERNARYAGVNWYRHHLDELQTISAAQTRMPTESP